MFIDCGITRLPKTHTSEIVGPCYATDKNNGGNCVVTEEVDDECLMLLAKIELSSGRVSGIILALLSQKQELRPSWSGANRKSSPLISSRDAR